jgi:hypothetical protein
MLPPFDESGNLPRGVHRASIEEIVDRFGHGSPEREVEIRELMVDCLGKAARCSTAYHQRQLCDGETIF